MQLLPVWVIFLAAAIRLFGGLAYLRATLAGRARPHAISWLIWSITPLISFFAELSAGVGIIAFLTLALAASPMMVFFAALFKDIRLLRADRFDMLCITIALFGIVMWFATDSPAVAISIAIIADTVSCLPTLRKAYRDPHSEYPLTFLLSAGSMVLALLATQSISFEAFAFPVYVLSMNLLIASLAMRPGKQSRRRAQVPKRKRRAARVL